MDEIYVVGADMNNFKAQQKSFFLGIGAAKSGTSWLYDYLVSHPDVAPGPIKEMHILNQPGNAGLIRAIKELPWHRFAGRKWLAENLMKAYYRADWSRYYRKYLNILAGDCSATGEISTSYMNISVTTLAEVCARFSANGVRCYGLLVLRDPVERFISDIRFHKRLSIENRYVKSVETSLDELVFAAVESKADAMNQQYQGALASLAAAFNATDYSVICYEELFCQDTLDTLCDRLGLGRHNGDMTREVNKTPSSEMVSEQTRHLLAVRLAPSYAAAAEVLGSEKVNRLWRGRWSD